MSTYSEMEELIRLGAYRAGSNLEVDEAIIYQPALDAFLSQNKGEATSLSEGYADLARILNSTEQESPETDSSESEFSSSEGVE